MRNNAVGKKTVIINGKCEKIGSKYGSRFDGGGAYRYLTSREKEGKASPHLFRSPAPMSCGNKVGKTHKNTKQLRYTAAIRV
ncbi:hypothetical protein E2C01_071998 [Portunus trituberculatus]|uniref:Uncharacterized protein n=1 Tax=Portunus trituberculatus TaxID=210409 RepID=A0A5B7HWU3_PORTR|nr:hypothetical protein [Portunus trituberculatus]